MRVLSVTATLIAILVGGAGLVAFQWWPFGSNEPSPDSLVENQRLRSQNENLVRENARLSADNENLRERLNELRRDEAERGPLEVEIERLTGERDRARNDLAEARAITGQLERTRADARETVIRLEEVIRNMGSDRRDGPGSFGWLPVLMLLVLVAALALWRESWWRSRIFTARPLPAIHERSNALARPVAGVPSVKTNVQDR